MHVFGSLANSGAWRHALARRLAASRQLDSPVGSSSPGQRRAAAYRQRRQLTATVVHRRLLGDGPAQVAGRAGQGPHRLCCCPTRPRRPATSVRRAVPARRRSRPPGSTQSQFKIDNAQGSARRCRRRPRPTSPTARPCCSIDALDSGSGAAIEANAKSKGVAVIDYDRLTLGGTAGRTTSASTTSRSASSSARARSTASRRGRSPSPNILVMDGDPTDNNAKLFAQGYNGVLKPKFDDRHLREGRRARPARGRRRSRATDVPAAVHRAPEHQRGGHAERRQRQRRDRRPAEAADPAEDVPDDRSGRIARRPAEHPEGLPVRHGVQADLPRGAGRRRDGALPAGRREAAGGAGERHDQGHHRRTPTSRRCC